MCESTFNGWNPIIQGCTLASYVMFVLKHEYIKQGEVGYVPEEGYGGGNNSVLALKYIQWLEKKNPGLKLKYKLRGGEHCIDANGRKYYLDAYNPETREIYEIYGCLYHGCSKCHPIGEKFSPVNKNRRMESLLAETLRREAELRAEGYTVHAKWECEIRKEMANDPEMHKFFKLCRYTHRLIPREALYGGRTQAFRSITQATTTSLLNYLDFTSLYPYLNAGGTAYPFGNPRIISAELPKPEDPLTYRGLVYCDVLPDPNAEIGFLPQKISQKLMFVLCRTCGESQNISRPCTHTKVSERYLTGVWCTDELNYAISKGYKVLRYHEIWHWDRWVAGGFFADYIKPLLKMKHESSGWPRPDMTDDEKDAYIKKIWDMDGVQLDPTKIKVNKALRSLAKLFLNSAWGKFAQNPDKVETKLIRLADAVGMTKFLNDPKYEPVNMIPFGTKKYFLSRRPKKEALLPGGFTNLAIAAQTTSAARLRLTQAMEKAGIENMIYCDTDSVIYKENVGENKLESMRGEQLGFLTDEIPAGRKLKEVVVMAPKMYALRMEDEQGASTYSVKAKGVSLTSKNSEAISFNTMKETMNDFISEGISEPLVAKMMTFKRGDNALDGLWTCVTDKRVNPKMDKGHYDIHGVVTPFGQLPTNTLLIDDYPFYDQ
ncbi:hypothetical protein CRE_05298 [Caenorhabditis remanei]|uniref:DNA-directed DNA polymerase n=3 Tax=Caenorhabditis remanei TaxID=31234 RepID=E3NNU2_CAERE|nr:hypothetical protein CRE_05298 [Caenorhabditis remanei]